MALWKLIHNELKIIVRDYNLSRYLRHPVSEDVSRVGPLHESLPLGVGGALAGNALSVLRDEGLEVLVVSDSGFKFVLQNQLLMKIHNHSLVEAPCLLGDLAGRDVLERHLGEVPERLGVVRVLGLHGREEGGRQLHVVLLG